GFGNIWDHILGFWKVRHEPNVLFNTFEEMKKDLPGVVKRTADFLGHSLTSEQLDRLCDHLSFESMKKNKTVSHEDEFNEIKDKQTVELKGEVQPFMRKGQVGGWKSDLSPQAANKEAISIQTSDIEFKFELLKGPLAEKYSKANSHHIHDGLVKITPSGCCLPSRYQNHFQDVLNFKVRPDDVWVVTYPKCGTTWTQELAWLLINDLDFETAKNTPLIKRAPFLEFGSLTENSPKHVDTLQIADNLKSPRSIKSHLPVELLPKQLWTVKPKIIYVAREAKDALVSAYHHHRLFFSFTETCDEFAEYFMAGIVGFGSLWDHILGFWKLRHEENILFNTFEDMKKDLPGVVKRTADFLGRSLTSDQLEKLCDHLSFQSMKNNKAVSHEEEFRAVKDKRKSELNGEVQPFMRKGQVGGWKSDLSPEAAEKVDNWSRDKVKGTDYPSTVFLESMASFICGTGLLQRSAVHRNISTGETSSHKEHLEGPLVEKLMKSMDWLYTSGVVKITPSNCCLFPEYQKHLDSVRHFKVLPDDVWIVTYPKCGTTWTQELIWLLLNDLDFNKASSINQIERSPFFEFGCLVDKDVNSKYSVDTLKASKELKSPRCIKSHLPIELLPEQLWTVKPKIIYVAREAKDVAVSYYHHHRFFQGYTGILDDFVEAYLAGIVAYGSIWDHILGFWEVRHEPYILFNTYEEMKKDLPGVIKKTAKFLGRSLNSEQMDQLCEYLSFESMRKNPAVSHDEFRNIFETKEGIKNEIQPFIRKGQVGGWKSELTPELAKKIDKWTEERLEGTDYPFLS
ncbi:hypothetical protein L9F63_008796, partial [Diploptera punctata]